MVITDRIEKQVVLGAAPSVVWHALTDFKAFGAWFGVVFTEPFAPGARLRGRITYPGYEHLEMDITIERMEPERRFSWRWHPHDVDPAEDTSNEPTTLVAFDLEPVAGGTRLTVVESGFDGVPIDRREKAFRANDGGWTEQMRNIEKYVARNA
jgi:uncharacterized protein YndB with AHSA1/START domain